MKTAKVGNTTLKFNESRAVKTEEEIDSILEDVVVGARNSIIAAEVNKSRKSTA